jgi:capsular polysaccharide biosynthesis protein
MRTLMLLVFRPFVAATLVALAVCGVMFLTLSDRPAEYSARVGLLASPLQKGWATGGSGADFPAVAAQSMAAIVESAHSPSVLAQASLAVPGAPSPEDLFRSVNVELVPGSNLARITVQASSPELASDLARTISNDIVGMNLFRPVGTLRIIDDQPFVTEANTDQSLTIGMTLASGAVAGVAIYGLLALLRPSRNQQIARAFSDAGIDRPVPVLGGGKPREVFSKIDMLATAAARRVRVIGLTPQSARDAEKLALELETAGVRVATEDDDRDAAVVGVASQKEFSGDIRWAIAALPNPDRLIAIVLQ